MCVSPYSVASLAYSSSHPSSPIQLPAFPFLRFSCSPVFSIEFTHHHEPAPSLLLVLTHPPPPPSTSFSLVPEPLSTIGPSHFI